MLGSVGSLQPPYLVLPLTVEPLKARLCYDARYLNLWMRDMPFSLDRLSDLPRYVGVGHYQTVLDDKSGYDHILLTEESRAYFGIQFVCFCKVPQHIACLDQSIQKRNHLVFPNYSKRGNTERLLKSHLITQFSDLGKSGLSFNLIIFLQLDYFTQPD